MNYELEEYRNSLTNTSKYFYSKAKNCKTPKELRDLIVTQIKGCSAITSYNIIYVSSDSDTAKAECPDWQPILSNLERLLFEFAKADGYLLVRFSNDQRSTAIILPDNCNPGLPIFGGLIGGGIESLMFYEGKLNSLLAKFISSSEMLIA